MTPSGLPTWARVAIGVVAEAAFFAYVFVVGAGGLPSGDTADVSRAARRAIRAPVVGSAVGSRLEVAPRASHRAYHRAGQRRPSLLSLR